MRFRSPLCESPSGKLSKNPEGVNPPAVSIKLTTINRTYGVLLGNIFFKFFSFGFFDLILDRAPARIAGNVPRQK